MEKRTKQSDMRNPSKITGFKPLRPMLLGAICGLAFLAFYGCSKEEPASPSNNPSPGTTKASGAKKKIVFVFKKGGISYSEACKAGADQANSDPAIGAEVQYEAPTDGTSEQQKDIVEQAIVGHADAIVVSPVDSSALIPALNKAAAAGIKVFTWDADSPKSKRLFYVAAADDVEIGRNVGDALAKDIGGKGKVLLMSGQSTAENLNLHLKGIQSALSKYPGITLVLPVVYNDDDEQKAPTMAAQALQAHPDVTGIACTNSPSPKASGEAIRKSNLIGKVKVWGLGLPSQTKPYLLDGSVSGLFLWDPQRLTYLTAKLVKDTLDGKTPQDGDSIGPEGKISVKDGIVTLPLQLKITKENVESLKF